ncbi:MAG TPA: serine protease [Bacteroidales bacterium]|nr:serine protease [Bacteroidales bacterium]
MKALIKACKTILIPVVFQLLMAGCAHQWIQTANPGLKDNRYDSEFPYRNCAAELDAISGSVKKVNCYATYRTYVFGEKSRITLHDLSGQAPFEQAQARVDNNESVSGTALVIASDGEKLALLTCAHIADLPDTIIHWSEHSDLQSNRYIHSISLKLKQQLYVRDIPDGNQVQLLASDVKEDIAILGRKLAQPPSAVAVFGYPAGNSDQLEWGSFVYLVGYPLGQLMITKGIVSKPADRQSNFLTDAPFNEGFSGGIVLAVRDGVPNFELVGIGRAVSARKEYSLRPEKEMHEYAYNPAVPYNGNTYVREEKEINYGVTFVIPVNKLRQFYELNRSKILEQGYNLDGFFGKANK